MHTSIDPQRIRRDFPIYQHQQNFVYLDSTATSLKPTAVIQAVNEYYEQYSANVFRGIYALSEQATAQYERARRVVAKHLNAAKTDEVVFVRGATEALNLITYTLGREVINEKSEIVVSGAEHHANFVPWQQLAFSNGASFKVVEANEAGQVPLDDLKQAEQVITKNTAIVALFYVSNVLGTINPIGKIVKTIKKINPNTLVVVDAAQAIPSLSVDVQELGCDFLVFSGHKVFGPTGIGVLWGKYKHLVSALPFQYGGEMIEEVSLTRSTFAKPPHKFEAGTPHIAGAIGLAAALEYKNQFSSRAILEHERALWRTVYDSLSSNKHIHLIGPQKADDRVGIYSFYHDKIHAHDLSQVLAGENICVRAGHHCAMPLHTQLGVAASVRASFYLYNTEGDVEALLSGIRRAEKIFS